MGDVVFVADVLADFVEGPGAVAAEVIEAREIQRQQGGNQFGDLLTPQAASQFIIKQRDGTVFEQAAFDPVDGALVTGDRVAEGQSEADDAGVLGLQEDLFGLIECFAGDADRFGRMVFGVAVRWRLVAGENQVGAHVDDPAGVAENLRDGLGAVDVDVGGPVGAVLAEVQVADTGTMDHRGRLEAVANLR